MSTTLEPMEPGEAVEMYLSNKENEAAEATVREHHYRLKKFVQWCELESLENINEITGRMLFDFRMWRQDEFDLTTLSLRNNLSVLRTFLKFCENIDAVEPDLYEKVELPTVDDKEAARDSKLTADRAGQIRTFLFRFKYATREHALFELLWHTGIRIGTARALDVDDVDVKEQRLRIRHRPDTDTPLKNGERAERFIALSEQVTEILDDWIETNRPEVEDKHGREPLFASTQGRCATSTLRRTITRVSQPCYYSDGCPHGRDISECSAEGYRGGQRCPSSISPHTIRRGSITHFLGSDVPDQVVQDRMNVSKKVLDKHYDKRSEERKVEQRRTFLNNV